MDKSDAKKRASRTTSEQHKIMLDFFTSNPGLAEGRFASIHGRLEANKKWEELSILLNGVKGANKSASQWQVTWRDLKSRTSVKARERRKEMSKTGGKPLTLPALTDLEMRVLSIVGENYAGGSNICPESFPEEEHLQLLLEQGAESVVYQSPTVVNLFDEEDRESGGQEDNWPVEALDITIDEPHCSAGSAPPKPKEIGQTRLPKRLPKKRTQMDSAREQFAIIANKQADAIMLQAESAKQQADASQKIAEATLLQANASERIASAIERLAISLEELVVHSNIKK